MPAILLLSNFSVLLADTVVVVVLLCVEAVLETSAVEHAGLAAAQRSLQVDEDYGHGGQTEDGLGLAKSFRFSCFTANLEPFSASKHNKLKLANSRILPVPEDEGEGADDEEEPVGVLEDVAALLVVAHASVVPHGRAVVPPCGKHRGLSFIREHDAVQQDWDALWR